MKMMMNVVNVVILVLPMLMFCPSLMVSAPIDPATLTPPLADPVLPTQTQPFANSTGETEARPEHHKDLNKKILIAVIVSSTVLGGILLSLSCYWIYRRKTLKNSDTKTENSLEASKGISLVPVLDKFNSLKKPAKKGNGSATVFEYELLVAATNDFKDENILGEGGSGRVYKALFSGQLVAAVKRLQGGNLDAEKEFENEIAWLSSIRHQKVIALLGYCIHNETRFLVYELMHNGSLELQLHGPSQGAALTWNIRMQIALDIARGLEYLHERCNPPIIHRDLKSSNILLDSNFRAKLSNFGLAIADGLQNKKNLNISGTLGYVAPEYLIDGKLTDKSDVYAFGVVLLELLLGRKAMDKTMSSECQSIVTWAMPQLTDRTKLPNMVDPVIKDRMDLKHLYQVAAVAVLCIQPEPSYRPLITDVLHSFIPLVPVELGGSLRLVNQVPPADA
ncbi:putative receptor-like protein kinase At1g80640 [Apium graveolens]|uniref:putative receptor-like protein kinase At1g80640 n=1 Tax=Apium graveolens TaxID=4045 RepID=UPI003D79FC65